MKEETLEEFIKREGYPEGHTQDIWETGVRDGIAWQQEQILQFLYSEITERRPNYINSHVNMYIRRIFNFKQNDKRKIQKTKSTYYKQNLWKINLNILHVQQFGIKNYQHKYIHLKT